MAGDPTGRISHLPNFHRGVSWKQPCRVATTANITISTALNAGDTIDGVTLAAGDRVLVKDQTAGAENGIYYAGVTPARDFDMDQDGTTTVTAEEVMGAMVYIIAGTLNAGKLYRNTNTTAPTLGTTALTFAEIIEPGWTTISPTQLAANTDNWNPTGLATADIIRVSTDASRNLTGITAPAAVNRHVILENIGAFDLVLKHDVTSTAANRFYCPNDTDLTLQKDSAALLAYDITSSRWRIIGGTGGGASFATPAIVLSTAAAAGAAATVIRSDSTIAAFDATAPVTQAFGDTAAAGSAAFAARRDHKHGMPAGISGTLLASITAASSAIANTETVVVSASIAANTLAVGQSFRIRGAGVGTTGAAPGNDTFRIRIGTTTLTGTIPTSVAAAANTSITAQPFTFEALVTIRTITASGTVIGECMVEGDNVATGLFTLLQALSATTATVAVDSTVANLLELTFQSGAASSNATFHVATIESLVASTGGGSAGALVLLEQHTASASATLDFTTCISGTYDDYQVELINVIPATNSVTLYMRFSTDGGSSYLATSYGWNHLFIYGAGTNGAEGSTSDVAIAVSGAAVASAGYGVSGTLRLYDPGASGTTLKVLTKDTTRDHATVGLVHDNGSGYRSVAAVNAFRFLFSSGNITSGTIRVYGIAKS